MVNQEKELEQQRRKKKHEDYLRGERRKKQEKLNALKAAGVTELLLEAVDALKDDFPNVRLVEDEYDAFIAVVSDPINHWVKIKNTLGSVHWGRSFHRTALDKSTKVNIEARLSPKYKDDENIYFLFGTYESTYGFFLHENDVNGEGRKLLVDAIAEGRHVHTKLWDTSRSPTEALIYSD